MTRKEIAEAIESKKPQIENLKSEIRDLRIQAILLCDETQWFTEQEEDVVVKRRPKKIERMLIGRIHWREDFKDEDTGNVITIDRAQLVRVNGEWQ